MALSIDSSTPAIVTQTNNTVATTTTASFTPPAGAVLLIMWIGDELNPPSNPTVTDNLGSPLTYAQTDWKRKADAGPNVFGQSSAWTAVVGSSAAMTVTVTSGSASGERNAALDVVVLTGADTASPVGAHGKSGSTSAAAISQAYTAQATGGQGFLVIADVDVTGAETAGAGTTIIGSANILSNIAYCFARRTSADDSNGASNSINTTLGGTSTNLAWVYVEIKPASTATATWLPTWTRRPAAALRPRRARAAVPPPPAPLAPGFEQARRIRGVAGRRRTAATPVPAQVVLAAPAYPPQPERIRLRTARLFRGRTFQPVPPQVVVTPPAYPPQPERVRLRGVRLFRPRVAAPVPAQVVVTPPSYVPAAVRSRLKLIVPRRHDLAPPIVDQPAPIQLDQRPRLRGRPVRSHVVGPPQPQQAPPPVFERLRLKVARLFRGRARQPIPPQIVVVPPERAAQAVRARRAQFAARRRRGGVEGWMVGGSHLCVITRPSTGTLPRPDTGDVDRPDTGIVINEC